LELWTELIQEKIYKEKRFVSRMKSRGISDIVVTVLIILFSLVALILLWAFISPQIIGGGEGISTAAACSRLDLRINSCEFESIADDSLTVGVDEAAQEVDVKLRRYATDEDEVDVSNIKFVFDLVDDDKIIVDNLIEGDPDIPLEIPRLYESKTTKDINVEGAVKISKVSIVPVITLDSGGEKDCTPSVPFVCKDLTS
jgi:hypothetical protein